MDDYNERYASFIAQYKAAWDAKLAVSTFYDKAILTLAGGSYGLSLAFIGQMAPEVIMEEKYLLILSWISLGMCILFTIISLTTSQYAIDKHIELSKRQFIDCEDIQKIKNTPSILTNFFSIAAGFTFFVGFIFLAIFSIKNI